MIKYRETEEFKKDFKKRLRKFKTLKDDFRVNKQYRIELFHCKNINSNSIFKVEGVGSNEELEFYVIKKFQCRSLKGRGAKSGIRVVYAYLPIKKEIVFLEMYFKGEQEKENKERIFGFINTKENP